MIFAIRLYNVKQWKYTFHAKIWNTYSCASSFNFSFSWYLFEVKKLTKGGKMGFRVIPSRTCAWRNIRLFDSIQVYTRIFDKPGCLDPDFIYQSETELNHPDLIIVILKFIFYQYYFKRIHIFSCFSFHIHLLYIKSEQTKLTCLDYPTLT